MNSTNTIYTVESHAMGEPLRLIMGGLPDIKGANMPEKKMYFMEHFEHLRRALMLEPRGHRDMFGAVLTAPTIPEADIGVIFMHGKGYCNMCGHGTIATATILVETGMVAVTEPLTAIKMETPAGMINVKVEVVNGKAKQVSFENIPSFLQQEGAKIMVPGYGTITLDVAFGGNFFAILDGAQLGIDIAPENAARLIDAGMAVMRVANDQLEVTHPELPHINTIDLCEIYGPAKSPGAHMQNSTIFDGQIDRSPCGTGTSAKLAALCAKGELKLNEEFVYESTIRTKFIGRALRETHVGHYRAIIPEITGSAYITGHSQMMIDPEDPVKYGFSL